MKKVEYKVEKPTYDISKSWDYNYTHGPFFDGDYPPLPQNKNWSFLGHKLISQLGIAAGPLPNAKWLTTYAKLGYGSLIQKTVRSKEHHSHPNPNVLVLDIKGKLTTSLAKPLIGHTNINGSVQKLTITNSFGNPCKDPKVWMKETRKTLKSISNGQLFGVSVYGSKIEDMSLEELAEDYGKTAQLAKKAGAMFIEANLACPNVEGFEDPFLYKHDLAVYLVIRAIKAKIGNTPLLLKIGYFDNFEQLIRVLTAVKGHFEGVSAINTISKKIVDKNGNLALPRREVSGVCGYAIKSYGIDMVKKLKRAQEVIKYNFEIIGVGGVMTPKDVLDYLNAGANHVHSATAVMWNPYFAYEVNRFRSKG